MKTAIKPEDRNGLLLQLRGGDDEALMLAPAAAAGLLTKALNKVWTSGSIPADLPTLARLLYSSKEELSECWRHIGDRFVPVTGDPSRLTCPEIERYKAKSRARSESARRSIQARWERERARKGETA
jgi:hypothetical protein